MARAKLRHLHRKFAARGRRWRNPILARSLARLSDQEVDDALARAGLTRKELFTARDAIAQHRVRMAHMLTALEIDVDDAVREHWDALKQADHHCSLCSQAGRCRRWLEWGRINHAPQVFCPNADLFTFIGSDQARLHLGRYLG